MAFQSECVNSIIVDFLANPQATPDSSCLATSEALAFVPPGAVTLPLLAEVNQLKPRVLAVFGAAALLLLVVLSPFVVWPIAYIVRALSLIHILAQDSYPVLFGWSTRHKKEHRIRILCHIF